MLPTLSRQAIDTQLKKKPLEDLKVIADIERFLIKKRGYVFKMPKAKSPVLLLHSGGADSTVLCDILLRKYSLSVYPVYFKRGQRRVHEELNAVAQFTQFFKSKFPTLYNEPFILDAPIPPREIRWPLTAISNNPTGKNGQWHGIPMYSALLTSYAVQTALFLETTKQLHIRTVFCGFIPSDGEVMAYETLTALRSITQTTMTLTHDPSWQITSLPLERSLGYYLKKESLLKWGHDHHIPLEKTWSCYWGGLYQCGACIGCANRKEAYKKANIPDTTVYRTHYKFFRIIDRIKHAVL